MFKSTISKEKFNVLKKYKINSDKIKALDAERKEILKGLFTNTNEDTISLKVRGEGIAFVVQKQISSTVSWAKLAKDHLDNAENLKPDYTKPVERFLVKF